VRWSVRRSAEEPPSYVQTVLPDAPKNCPHRLPKSAAWWSWEIAGKAWPARPNPPWKGFVTRRAASKRGGRPHAGDRF